MTRYTVVWKYSAQIELARLWLAAADRQAMTSAANDIDTELGRDATTKGVFADASLRELSVPPLRVLFNISEPDRLVTVTNVILISTP